MNNCFTQKEKAKKGGEVISQKFREKYESNPKKCPNCNKIIPWKKRRNKFCDQSCAASYNKNRKKYGTTYCNNCGIKLKNKRSWFCSNQCFADYKYKEYIKKWKNGEVNGSSSNGKGVSKHIRRYLFEKFEGECSRCGWCTENPYIGKVILEIEHLDGYSTNNREENLDLICPNCHSLTKTYKALNSGKGNREKLRYYGLIN